MATDQAAPGPHRLDLEELAETCALTLAEVDEVEDNCGTERAKLNRVMAALRAATSPAYPRR